MSYKGKRIPGLDWDIKTGLYKITEAGITYSFDHSMLVHLKNYCENGQVGSKGIIQQWYNDMNRFDRKVVKREGHQENEETISYEF